MRRSATPIRSPRDRSRSQAAQMSWLLAVSRFECRELFEFESRQCFRHVWCRRHGQIKIAATFFVAAEVVVRDQHAERPDDHRVAPVRSVTQSCRQADVGVRPPGLPVVSKQSVGVCRQSGLIHSRSADVAVVTSPAAGRELAPADTWPARLAMPRQRHFLRSPRTPGPGGRSLPRGELSTSP